MNFSSFNFSTGGGRERSDGAAAEAGGGVREQCQETKGKCPPSPESPRETNVALTVGEGPRVESQTLL